MLKKILLVVLILLLSMSALANIGFKIGIENVSGVYDATIRAWCYAESPGQELVRVALYANGSTVAAGDADIGLAVISFVSASFPYERHRENMVANGKFDAGEYVYWDLNAPGSSLVSAGDVRVTAVGSYPINSTVVGGDADIGSALVNFVSAASPYEKHREEITANGRFDVGEHVYQDLDVPGGSLVSAGDVRAIGYTTPYTFTLADGSHSFTVPATDPSGHPFTRWNDGTSTRTITISAGGIYAAYYSSYWSNVKARDLTLGTDESVAITKDGSPSGFNTPYNFTGLTGPHKFAVPEASPDTHPLAYNTWKELGILSSPEVSVEGKGNQTAQYCAYTIAAQYANGTAASVQVDRTGDPGNPYTTPKTFLYVAGSQTFTVAAATSDGVPFEKWDYSDVTQRSLTVSRGQTYTAIYKAYNVTIYAYSRTLSSFVNVTVQRSGDSTVYYTNFAAGKYFGNLFGDQTFIVAAVDTGGNPFSEWDNGVTSTSLTVQVLYKKLTYTAYYEAIKISAFSYSKGQPVNVAIYKNGVPTGFTTPHTFAGLAPPCDFTLPSLDTNGHPLQWWNTGASTSTITVTRGGSFTAYYRLPTLIYVDPPAISGTRDQLVWAYVKIYNLTDGWLWNPSVNPPKYEPLGNLFSASLKISWDPTLLEYSDRSVRVPVETYPDGILHTPTTNPKDDTYLDDDLVTSLIVSGTYLYAGLWTTPGKIVKIDLTNWTPVSTLTLATGENQVNALAIDGSYLYAGLGTTPGKIAKIDLTTFTKVSTLTLSVRENDIRALVVNSGYLYAGQYTTPGNVTKVNLATFTTVSTLALNSGENYIRALTVSGTDLYAGLYLTPGRVVKIALGTFTRTSALTLPATDNQVTSLAVSGSNLYAGLYTGGITAIGKVAKIAIPALTHTSTLTFTNAAEDFVTSLAVDGSYLYAGLYTSPGKVIKIDLGTFTQSNVVTFLSATSENLVRALAISGTNLYAGLYTGPAKIVKVSLSSFTRTDILSRYMSPYELSTQSQFNVPTNKWPLPFNNGSVTNHPTIFRIQFRVLKANTLIPLTLSDISLGIPPSGWEDPVTGEQKFSRPDIMGNIRYALAFDYSDLAAFARAYGSIPGNPNWNIAYDFNGDRVINGPDLQMLGKYFGKRT